MKIKVVSLFAGCGGLDLGFKMAGFDIIWANEFDKTIHKTYESNHPGTFLDKRDIRKIPSNEIPDCVGVIGGPPCQSWSEAGAQRGINDTRGKLFFEYIRVLRDKKPLFFLAENVSGMFHARYKEAFQQILNNFQNIGYNVSYKLINAKYYNVPQDRRRLFFIGYRKDLGKTFFFENIQTGSRVLTLKDAIWDLRKSAKPALTKNHTNGYKCAVSNHEYMVGGFSTIYMSRNRVRGWGEPSYTIQAGGRHAPIHPQANKMIKIEKNKWVFDPASPSEYRRLTIRECARVQTFPDSFMFYYNGVADGYKMIGNAVPVNLAYAIATTIRKDLKEAINKTKAKKNENKIRV
jgi:DNA (cytosine-5)-methyltransferase 1